MLLALLGESEMKLADETIEAILDKVSCDPPLFKIRPYEIISLIT